MTWRTAARRADDLKRRDRWLRVQGYDDGYAGRPASSTVAVYQAAWRRGRQAREAA